LVNASLSTATSPVEVVEVVEVFPELSARERFSPESVLA
jgi:hypothetical protein